jgi:hypothetical protein
MTMTTTTGDPATVPVINAHQFRKWADAASSYRGDGPFWLVYNEGGEPTIEEAEIPPAGAVFGVETREVTERPTPAAVIIDCHGSTRDLVGSYDAVFWTEAAVEKFVFPYYASKSLWDAADVLDKLSFYWYGTIPLVGLDGEGVGTVLSSVDAAPYAVAHTPDSDWNTLSLDGIGPIGSDIHLLVRDGDAVRAVRLSDLPDPEASAERAGRAPRTPAATAAG